MSITCQFTNSSELPIIVESWINNNNMISTLTENVVLPFHSTIISSDTGEWYLHNLLSDSKLFNIWKENGYEANSRIGKFRNGSAYDGSYSWMEDERFSIIKIDHEFIFRKL